MSHVTRIEECDDGFLIRWDNPDKIGEGGYVHLNAAWVEDFDRNQFKPYGLTNPALGNLAYGFRIGTLTVEMVGEWFCEVFDAAVANANTQRAKRRVPSGPLQEFIRSGRAKNS